MLLRICPVNRKCYLVVVKSLAQFNDKAKQLLNLTESFRCVLEEDGTEIVPDVLEAIIDGNEKIGLVMLLNDGEEWSPVNNTAASSQPADDRVPVPPVSMHDKVPHASTAGPSSQFQDVRAVLGSNPKGQNILHEYDRHMTLSSESRQTLVKIVVAQLVQECGPYPSKEQKAQLGSAIVNALPGLKDRAGITGYEHFFTESRGQTGYIQDRLKRIRRSLAPEAQQRPRSSVQNKEASTRRADDGACDLPAGEPVQSAISEAEVDKLRRDCLYANPATDKAVVLSAMAKTAAARQHWIRSDQPSITEVIDQYPRLEDMPFDLFDIDFRLHFEDSVGNFLADFPKWVPGIIAAARLSRKSSIVQLLRNYDFDQHTADQPTSRDCMYALMALLQLLPSNNTRHGAKASAAEVEKNLISFQPQQTSLELFLSQKNDAIHQQPFLLCLGSMDSPSSFYLILDVKALSLGDCDVLRAVDVLFKSHYVFWVGYAKPLTFFMEFVQKLVYKVECTRLSTRIRELKSSIEALSEIN